MSSALRLPFTVTRGLVVVVVIAGLTGCDTGLGATPDGALMPDAPASCIVANGYSDLASIEEYIFKRQCSFGPCHDAVGRPAEDLILLPGTSHVNLVGVPSKQVPELQLVEPGHPERSYIMIKLGEYDQSLRKKTIMPQGSVIGICIEKRDAIRRWIEQGAPAAPPDAAPDAAPRDGGGDAAAPLDARQDDAATIDGGAPDAGGPDAGGPDAGGPDAAIDAAP